MFRFKKTSSRQYYQPRRLGLEPLERRELLSINLVGTELQVLGASAADSAQVYSSNGVIYADLNGARQSFKSTAVASVRFMGYDGNDVFTNLTALNTVADGGAGNDVITGGSGKDQLSGGDGDDTLDGMAGDDMMWGNNGNDRLEGGAGNDLVCGEANTDTLYGEAGNDTMYGGDANDTIYGGDGNDLLSGEAGADTLRGESGNDLVYGNDGADLIYGQAGADTLCGGNGNDTIYGGDDGDCLFGEAGDDEVNGENGNDTVYGGDGKDMLYGKAGDDWLYGDNNADHLYGGTGLDRCYGGNGDDTLVSLDAANTDVLYGQSDFDSFWTDDSDTVSDATASESNTNLHRIHSFANGADRTLDGDSIADPTDGQNYKDFADKPLFAADGPTADDIDQNALADCWLMASMGAVAHTDQNAVRQTVVDLGDGTYAVRLGGDHYYRVDADLPTQTAASWTPIYAGLGVDDSLWAAIVEKAYTHYRSGANTYASIAWGSGTEGLAGMNATGTNYKAFSNYSSSQSLLDAIAAKLDSGLAVTCGIDTVGGGAPLAESHEYTVVGVNRDATGKVTSVILRNPWGPAGDDADVTVTGAQLFACVGTISWGSVG